MSTVTYFITGASRGLGLEFATQLLAHSPATRIIAAVRNPASAPELDAVVKANEGRVHVIALDVTSEENVKAAVEKLEASPFVANGIDVLINNAGVLAGGHAKATQGTIADVQTNFNTNVFGVVNTSLALLPLLRKGNKKQIFAVSSILGSISVPLPPPFSAVSAPYGVSKAAVNMWLVKLSRELASEDFTVVPFHPGYVKTDMNAGAGDITKEDSISQILKNVILKVTPAETGKFFNHTGDALPY